MKQRIQQLLNRYLSKKATPAEEQIVENWFDHHAADDSIKPLTSADRLRIFTDLDARVEAFLPHKRIRSFQWLKVAAVLLMCLSGLTAVYMSRQKGAANQVTYYVIRIPNGTKKEVILPDQTSVTLNSGSELRIASNFNTVQRNVILSGEAYFKVHHDAKRPFIICSGRLRTTVLGTSFNVRAYPGEANMQVAVTSGRVSVEEQSADQKFRSLSKGLIYNQVLSYLKANGTTRLESADADQIRSWTRNQLCFDNASLTEMVAHLQRWYNVPVKIKGTDCEPNKRYTIRFGDEPLSKVLVNFAALTGTTTAIAPKQVVITFNNCNPM